eukprot:654813-Pleurochrysis_carterae.AAC.2
MRPQPCSVHPPPQPLLPTRKCIHFGAPRRRPRAGSVACAVRNTHATNSRAFGSTHYIAWKSFILLVARYCISVAAHSSLSYHQTICLRRWLALPPPECIAEKRSYSCLLVDALGLQTGAWYYVVMFAHTPECILTDAQTVCRLLPRNPNIKSIKKKKSQIFSVCMYSFGSWAPQGNTMAYK